MRGLGGAGLGASAMNNRGYPLLALMVCAVCMLSTPAAAQWTDPGYLYRYAIWGPRHLYAPVYDYELFPSRTIANAPPVYKFARDSEEAIPDTVQYQRPGRIKVAKLDELLNTSGTTSLIVLRNGKLVYEHYFNGYNHDSICVSMSIAKSIVSSLVGIAIGEGKIKSINEPMVDYIPELKGPGFEAITVGDLLNMSSGLRFTIGIEPWDDVPLSYFDPNLHNILFTDLSIIEPPGKSFYYNGYDTELLGVILQRATHQTPSEYLSEKIWKPLGMEAPATWSIDSKADGFELMQAGINARAIDFAKFGQLYLNGGEWRGRQIVPHQWVIESTSRDPQDHRRWETFVQFHRRGGYYRYGWWGFTLANGEHGYMAVGKYGQYIFISPKDKVVIVRTGEKWGIKISSWPQIFNYIADKVSGFRPPNGTESEPPGPDQQ
jgi:CubicO group peptidase (beta-lactamase class C family)